MNKNKKKHGCKKVKKKKDYFSELAKRKFRRGPWPDSIKDLPPAEQGVKFIDRILSKTEKAIDRDKKKKRRPR